MSMKVISIITEKGGAAKTTLAWHLGILLDNKRGNRVLLLDADAKQRTLWRTFEFFRDAEAPVINEAHTGNIDEKIAEAAELGFTHCIIDTPPHVGAAVEKAVQVADLILAPLAVSPLDAVTFDDTYEVIQANKRSGTKAFSVLTRASTRSKATLDEFSEFLAASCPDLPQAPAVMHERTAYRDSIQSGRGISETRDLRSLQARNEITKLAKFIEKEIK
ncbi:AAA family ATPase [Sulfitobacter sp. PM12]|uniref:AAA family ATPase n=1 Tax=Sulfitobacter sp. PM12 TaxID=3138497 RepID=UPI0038906138